MVFLGWTALASGQVQGNFSTVIERAYDYGYVLHQPSDTKKPKPLIVFLHGSGEKGTNLELVKVHGPLKYLKSNTLDAWVLAPQCPDGAYWEAESLYRLIRKIMADYPIDGSRVHLTGLSMGGWGAWNLAFAHPELFASLTPICGFVDRVPMIENCRIKDIPTRIYHGLLDEVVPPEYSIAIYKKLKPCHGNLSLTIFDDANHDAWTRVYDDPTFYHWILNQRKTNTE